MKFRRNGEPADGRYRMVKDALSDCSRGYLENVVDVLGNKRVGNRMKDNGPGFMAIAARYLLVDKYESEVEKIDVGILKSVAERLGICRQIGEEKKRRGLPIYVPGREREVLERVGRLAAQHGLEELAKKIFRDLMGESKRVQAKV